MPGAGKTSCASELATILDLPFADTDDLIESACLKNISSIFTDSGEETFRLLEKTTIEIFLTELNPEKTNQCQAELDSEILMRLKEEVHSFAKRSLLKDGFILAVGGGLPCDLERFELLKRLGKLVFLDCQAHILAMRLKGDTKRPLLNGSGSSIKELLSSRREIYQKADLTVDTSNLSINDVAKTVRLRLERAEKV